MLKAFLLFVVSLFPISTVSAQYMQDERLRFADHLFKRKDFSAALFEYKSAGSFDSLHRKIFFCHYLLRNFDSAMAIFDSIKPLDYKVMQVKNRISLANGKKTVILTPENQFEAAHNAFMLAGDMLLQFKSDSFNYYRNKSLQQAADTFIHNHFMKVEATYQDFNKQGKKSPFLAGSLSAIIPGSGKIYCSRPLEAISPFLKVAGSGIIAYEGFRKNGFNSPQFYIFGAIASVFYISNITGAVKLARIQNRKNELRYKNAVLHEADLAMQYLLIRD